MCVPISNAVTPPNLRSEKKSIISLFILCEEEKYVIFDDYGQLKMSGVKHAVDESVWLGNMEIVKYIGIEPNTTFGNLIFDDYEGVICLVKQ